MRYAFPLPALFLCIPTGLLAQGPDLEVSALRMHEFTRLGDNTIAGTVTNRGSADIHGFTLAYSIDGGTPVSQAFTVTVPAGGTRPYAFDAPWNAVAGEHTVTVAASAVEGDAVPGNDTFSATTKASGGTTPRTTVIEEFTSSTCGPCAAFNVGFDPLLQDLGTNMPGSRIAAVKYQMNWPPPGNDPSYNAHGNSRRSFYSVSSIPSTFIDGGELQQGTANEINGHVDDPAVMLLDVSYELNGNTITVTARTTPLQELSGSYKLYIAVTENYYDYPASTTTQDEFHYAMRRMLPGGSGTPLFSLTPGEEQVVTESYDLVEGGAAQGNFNLWGTLEGITVVAFVQKTIGRQIYQGAIATSPVGVEEQGAEALLGLYPNPSTGLVRLSYARTAKAVIEVTDVLGATVLRTERGFQEGTPTLLDLGGLGNGLYSVTVTTADGARSTRKVLLER